MRRFSFFIVATLVLATSATAQPLSCHAPQKPMLEATLFFGRGNTIHFGISESRWQQFLATEITPRFPDGLTVLGASGQWRAPQSSRILHERSKVLIVGAAGAPQTYERIEAISAVYKQRLRQQSVGVVTRPVCASF